jgi:hypothetical protein
MDRPLHTMLCHCQTLLSMLSQRRRALVCRPREDRDPRQEPAGWRAWARRRRGGRALAHWVSGRFTARNLR